MKLNNANTLRTTTAELLMNFFKDREEDCGMIASNTFNFPVVTEDGEEGWIEVTVKVPKGTKDEEYDGYSRREQYQIEQREKAEKKAKAKEAKEKKIKKDKERREKKAE